MEFTTASEPQSTVKDPLDFKDVRSGVREAQKDAQCTTSGAEQAGEAATNEQGTVATSPCLDEAPKTVQDMLAINRSPVDPPQWRHHACPIASNTYGDFSLQSVMTASEAIGSAMSGEVPAAVLRCNPMSYGELHYPAETSIKLYADLISGFQPCLDAYRGPCG